MTSTKMFNEGDIIVLNIPHAILKDIKGSLVDAVEGDEYLVIKSNNSITGEMALASKDHPYLFTEVMPFIFVKKENHFEDNVVIPPEEKPEGSCPNEGDIVWLKDTTSLINHTQHYLQCFPQGTTFEVDEVYPSTNFVYLVRYGKTFRAAIDEIEWNKDEEPEESKEPEESTIDEGDTVELKRDLRLYDHSNEAYLQGHDFKKGDTFTVTSVDRGLQILYVSRGEVKVTVSMENVEKVEDTGFEIGDEVELKRDCTLIRDDGMPCFFYHFSCFTVADVDYLNKMLTLKRYGSDYAASFDQVERLEF